MTKLLAWTDLETTGIDEPITLLEAAVVVTDLQLNELGRFTSPIRESSEDSSLIMLRTDPYVQSMHSRSGLWDAVDALGMSLDSVETYMVDTVVQAVKSVGHNIGDDGLVISMAGSGVERFDRKVVEAHLPHFSSLLHYGSTDVSSIRRFIEDLAPEAMPEALRAHLSSEVPHRALEDVEYHIETARIIRDFLVRGA